MLNKKHIIVFLIMLLGLVLISSVSASNLDRDATANASFEEVGVDDMLGQENGDDSDSFVGVDSNSYNVSRESNGDDAPLGASSNKGTFTELQNKINKAPKGSTIYLDKDYYYNNDFGGKNGIKITKPITIDGKGHTIDGKEKSALLLILKTKNVVLKNLVFKNGNIEDLGSVGIFYSNNVKFNKCSFDVNRADDGGAVFLAYSNYSSFVRCSFDENYAGCGGAVYLDCCHDSSFIGCSFDDNGADDGGAVYLWYSSSSFDSCSFGENEAFAGYGGAVYLNYSSSSFDFCGFYGNYASYDGGAVYIWHSSSSFEYCSIDKNYVEGASGTICSIQSCLNMLSTNFSSNWAYSAGGDIYSQYSMIFLSNSSFFDSYSPGFGGSLSFDNDYVDISGCTFEECYSYLGGGAIYSMNSILNVFSSEFSDGTSGYGGAICSINTELVIQNDSFENICAPIGGVIYSIYGSLTVDSSVFSYSYAIRGGVMYISNPHKINNIANNLFLYSSAIDIAQRIYVDGYYAEIPESGNIYEDIYFVIANFTHDLNDEEICDFSNVLTYVLSNSNGYQNNLSFYNNLRDDFTSKIGFVSNNSSDIYFNIFDKCCPNNSTILLKYDNYNQSQIMFNSDYLNNEVNSSSKLETYFYNVNGDVLDNVYIDDRFSFKFEDEKLVYSRGSVYNFKKRYNPVPLFNQNYYTDILPDFYYSDYTSIKNQDIGNNCWAFAGIATLETCIKMMTGEEYDFSENNAKNLMAASSIYGLDINPNTGGYDSMFIGYLASWLGPVFEESDMYNPLSSLSVALNSKFHIQDILFLQARHNSSDNDEFKHAIYNYGAVSAIVNWTTNNLSRNWHIVSQRNIISGVSNWRDDGYKGLHAISIIGWDDNYNDFDSLGNYAKGAWIFKNSWGESWEYGGIGFLSYDQKLSCEIAPYMHAYTFAFNDGDVGYQDIYQYDFAGLTDYLCTDRDYIYYKNKFVAREDEYLYAFSTYFEKPTWFISSVRINGKDVTMTDDNVTIDDSLHYSPAGYHTIDLGYNLTLNEGDEFEIVIVLLNIDGNGNYIPVCQADELYKLTYPSNVSFFSYDGVNWFDLYDLNSNVFAYGGTKSNSCQVACIKAFTAGWRYDSMATTESILSKSHNIFQMGPYLLSNEDGFSIMLDIHDWDYDNEKSFENFVEVSVNGEIYYLKVINGSVCLDRDDILYYATDYYGNEYYACSAKLKSNFYTSNLVEFFIVDDKLYLGTFSGLEDVIANAEEGSIINLDKDYYFDVDFINKSYIVIEKSLTIDGNGHILNALSQSGIFTIDSNCSVNLMNITFKNGIGDNGGAICSYGNLNISNCNFEDNSADYGGALYSEEDCFIVNSVFDFNHAKFGGAIYMQNATCNMDNVSFDIVKKSVLKSSGLTKVYGERLMLQVTLKDSNGNPIQNSHLNVKLNGKTIAITYTNKYNAILSVNLPPNTYTLNISYAGNEKYSSASIKVKVVIKKATPKITAYKKTFKLKTKTKKYTITLKNNLGKAMKNTKVTIKVNGKTYTAKTNSKGKATFKITKLNKKGSFTATVKYAGNKYYKSVTKKVTIAVKK